jgi:hypothetical protein
MALHPMTLPGQGTCHKVGPGDHCYNPVPNIDYHPPYEALVGHYPTITTLVVLAVDNTSSRVTMGLDRVGSITLSATQ